MDQLDEIVNMLDGLKYSLLSIQESIVNSFFPDLIQDISMYQDFDWSSIHAKVVMSDDLGAAVLIYKGNVFKRKIEELEIYYESCHRKKMRLIAFKDLEIDLLDFSDVDTSKFSASVALGVSKNFPPIERLKIQIRKVKVDIEKAEKIYHLNQAAELKYGVLTRLEQELQDMESQQKQGKRKK